MRAEGERTGAYCAVIWVGVGAYLGLPSVGRIGQVYSLCPGGGESSQGRECACAILRNERGSYGRNDRRLGLAGGLGLCWAGWDVGTLSATKGGGWRQ